MLFLRQYNIEVGFNPLVVALAAASNNAIPTRAQNKTLPPDAQSDVSDGGGDAGCCVGDDGDGACP